MKHEIKGKAVKVLNLTFMQCTCVFFVGVVRSTSFPLLETTYFLLVQC